MDLIVVILAPATVYASVPLFVTIMLSIALIIGQINSVEFTAGYSDLFHSIMNIAGILICPIASLRIYVKSRKKKLPATLLTTLCFLLLQVIFLFMLNRAELIDGVTSNPMMDSLIGYTIGWTPMVLYAIILGLGARSNRCNFEESAVLFRSVGLSFVLVVAISQWAASFVGEVYTALFEIIFWNLSVFILALIVNYMMFLLVRGIYRIFAGSGKSFAKH